jgi:phenylpropionate dioxygenase-like ring-hydroxylating dioxygenase large terminal subunit
MTPSTSITTDGLPLPGTAFIDEDIYSKERRVLFNKKWISITVGQVVPEPGDVFPCTIAGLALLVVRDRDHSIHVYYNMCRHRGALLVDQACKTKSGLITCPYHAWSFKLNGDLFRAPYFFKDEENTQPDEVTRAGLGLIKLRSVVWRDIVFVDVNGKADDFENFIQPIDERLQDWSAAEIQSLASREYRINANWKLAAENFLDGYHLPKVHPQLGGGMAGALLAEDLVLSEEIFGFVMPGGYGPGTRRDEEETAVFKSLPAEKLLYIEVYCIFPNTLILVECDFQQVITLRPQGAGITHETFADYVPGQPSSEEEKMEMIAFSQGVNDQDETLLNRLQLSRSMDIADKTHMSSAWDQSPARFQQTWLRHMSKS